MSAIRTSQRAERGFTLVELMAVVVITGVLAAIGVILVRKHVRSAKTVDAVAGIQAIRAAEEAYRAEQGQYLNCSVVNTPLWYPMTTPGTSAYAWKQPNHAEYANWARLGVAINKPMIFGFAVNAGAPAQAMTTPKATLSTALPASPADPWYVIQVKGDRDGNGVAMLGVATSINGETFFENPDE